MTAIIILLTSPVFISCDKHQVQDPPLIALRQDSGFLYKDTVLQPGEKVRIGIRASGSGANLTYFSIRLNDGSSHILLDTGMNNPRLEYSLEVIKTTAPVETWSFLVMDRNRVETSVQIVLRKSEVSKWGKIRIIDNITLGAQENGTTGSFFSLADTTVMTLGQAFTRQAMVDMIYYYGLYEGTLSSPNEAEAPGFFTGPDGLANWTVKNETRYDTTVITPQVFDLSTNDSLILTAYEPTAGKKKGKFLQPGMVLSFRSPAGKLGLVKITGVTPMPDGMVAFSIKIQE